MFLTGNVKVEEDADSNMKRLLEDVVYEDHKGIVYTIPAGYVTDYASIPRALSWIYPKDGPYRKAAIVHDYLITNGLAKKEFEVESNRVDEIFREAMQDTGGIPKIRQHIMWAGVRLGAIGNKIRRKGSLKTLPKVLAIIILAAPFITIPSLIVQIFLTLLFVVTLPLPKRQRVDAQKT
jgi:uncharacterized protein DUF1353